MAEAGVTTSGLTELVALVDRLDADVVAALRTVAQRSAERIRDRARSILDSKTGGKADRIAVFAVVPDEAHHAFLVTSEGAVDKPANLALWFERGTRFMEARPALRPAADVEEHTYRTDSEAAAAKVLEKLSAR